MTGRYYANRKYHFLKNGRGGEIRTHDLLDPNQARYQTTLHPDIEWLSLAAAEHQRNLEKHLLRFASRLFPDKNFWTNCGMFVGRFAQPSDGLAQIRHVPSCFVVLGNIPLVQTVPGRRPRLGARRNVQAGPKRFLFHGEIRNGATLSFEMGESPSKWGQAIAPPSGLELLQQ
jgi:hypothetical protein